MTNNQSFLIHEPLLQIPKYWNLRLSELDNVIKEEYDNMTITDLLQNFKYESSNNTILNIPAFTFKREKISKIDIATKKRKLHRLKRQAKCNSTDKKNEDKQMRVVYERIKTHRGTVTNFGVHVHGYSETSSSSSYESSSEDEKQINEVFNKLDFLKMLDLTSLPKCKKKSSRLEPRNWPQNWLFSSNEIKKTVALDLPVPCKSSSTLNNSPDYYLKSNFLLSLELQANPFPISCDFEKIWYKIIKERLKRNCESPVTLYCKRFYEEHVVKFLKSNKRLCKQNENLQNQNPAKEIKPYVESLLKNSSNKKLLERNTLAELDKFKRNNSYCCINIPAIPQKLPKLEIVLPQKRKLSLLESDKRNFGDYEKKWKPSPKLDINSKRKVKIEESVKNTSTQTSTSNFVVPVTMILVDNRTLKDEVKKLDKGVQCQINGCSENGKVQKWSGIQNTANFILESYVSYCKDTEAEKIAMKEVIKNLQETIKTKQTQRVFLECKLRTLQSTSQRLKQHGAQLQKTLCFLSKVVSAFR